MELFTNCLTNLLNIKPGVYGNRSKTNKKNQQKFTKKKVRLTEKQFKFQYLKNNEKHKNNKKKLKLKLKFFYKNT